MILILVLAIIVIVITAFVLLPVAAHMVIDAYDEWHKVFERIKRRTDQ